MMTFTAIITTILAMAGPAEIRVPVCLKEHVAVPAPIMMSAREWAAMMFRGAGVDIRWTCGNVPDSGFRTPLVISLVSHAPDGFRPSVMAYALPYEGVHIVIFYDRIEIARRAETILAYVLVHEITHILEGQSRHSETGVMKARWGLDDYARMLSRQLTFAPEDIERIHSSRGTADSPKGLP
jgi:hypothetical protein